MKIAVLGTKGIPARFGGIERHCDELYPRMAARGHEVTVFVRRWYTPVTGPYKGVTLKAAPTANFKGLDAFAHTAAGSFEAMFQGYDIVHYHAIGPSLFSFMPRLSRGGTVATVHALDWQRAKWGRGARAVLKAGEWASAHFPQRTIVVSQELKKYFMEKYGRETVYIPNGVVPVKRPRASELVRKLGLEPGNYLLFLRRMSRQLVMKLALDIANEDYTTLSVAVLIGAGHIFCHASQPLHVIVRMAGASRYYERHLNT